MTITKNVWKAAAVLLILCLVSTVMISGTYAKYTSEYAGQDTALVAKWNVVTTGGGIGLKQGEAAQLDLFSHTYTNNIVASRGGDYLIAPGVSGQFTVALDNNSDVAADITFTTAATGTTQDIDNLPIKYWTASDLTSRSAIQLGDLLNAELGGTVQAGTTQPEITVFWSWPFTGNAATDTKFGVSSAAIAGGNGSTYILNITASAIQQAPTK